MQDMKRFWVMVVSALLVASAIAAGPADEVRARVKKEGRDLKVLFVGNSYSFTLPKEFQLFAKREGATVTVGQITQGGMHLDGHAADDKALKEISSGDWDVVVLQEQSQIPSFPTDVVKSKSLPAVQKLAGAARDGGAVPVLFQTWGRRDGNSEGDTFELMNQRLAEGYALLGSASNPPIYVVPVGVAWAKVMAAGKGKKLYQNDGSHPSNVGMGLAAAMFYASLYYDKPGAASFVRTGGLDRQLMVDAVVRTMQEERAKAKQ